ncbi:T9SS type A sorting domain-containing protein [Candidatus Woesearchaeota archaeon]|nr:T9SS type A sorting domain-containing protein [Candidatus Woesearchaeota archaeon]
MSLKHIVRNAKYAVPITLGLLKGIQGYGQEPNQVRLDGMVRDTSGHVIENANVNIWKAADQNIFESLETDLGGTYLVDMATPVTERNYAEKPLTVINNGNSNTIGITGTVPETPQSIHIINSIGQLIDNIPFDYNANTHELSTQWQSDDAGLYFAQITSPNNKEILKIITTNDGPSPRVNIDNNKERGHLLKAAATNNPITYYIEVSADGNEAIDFATVVDSIQVYNGETAYPEHVVTPNLESYSAPVVGQVTLGGKGVGEGFNVELTPEQGNPQTITTDVNGRFNTTFNIPYQAFPYDPKTITLRASATPSATSLQTTNANKSISITDSDTPFTLDMAVDSAHISLSGYLGLGVNGSITVDGKEIFSGNFSESYDFDTIKTVQKTIPVTYNLHKHHHEDVNETTNVNVWDEYTFSPSFSFIPAEYTASITTDSGTNVTVKTGDETLWEYVATPDTTLGPLQRTELDSILVNINATRRGAHDLDSTLYMYENKDNNWTLKPETIQASTSGQVKREDDIPLSYAAITFTNLEDITTYYEDTLNAAGNYDINNLFTDSDGEQYIVHIKSTTKSPAFKTLDTIINIQEGENNHNFIAQQEDPVYGRAFGFVERTDYLYLPRSQITFTMQKNTTKQFIDTTDAGGVYDLYNLPTDADGEDYNVHIEPTATSPPFLPYDTTLTIFAGENREDILGIQKIPHSKINGVIRDMDALMSIDGTLQDEAIARLPGVIVEFMNDPNNTPYDFTDDVELDRDTTDANGYYESNIRFTPGTEIYLNIGGKAGYYARGGTINDWRYTITEPDVAIDSMKTFDWTLPRETGTYDFGANDTITLPAYQINMMTKNQNIEHAMGRGALFNYEAFLAELDKDIDQHIANFQAAIPNAHLIRTMNNYHLTIEDEQNYNHQNNYYPDSVITFVSKGPNITSNNYTKSTGEWQILYSKITWGGNETGFNKEHGRAIGLGEVNYDSFMDEDGGPITNRDKRVATLILNQGQARYLYDYDSFSYKNLRENE